MGLIEKIKQFKKKRLEKKLARNLKLIKNAKAIREDRVAAIDFFANLSDYHSSVPALLQRFEYSLEHGINDTREKDAAKAGIVKHGKSVLPLVEEHLKKTSRIAWPIKIIKELAEERELTQILFECLDFSDVSLDHEKVDKNYDLLCYLRDFSVPDPLKLLNFINVHDERVRFAAVEVLLNQKHEEIPGKLEHFLVDTSAENTRIRQSVTHAFLQNHWAVKDPGKLVNAGLMPGMYLNQKSQLEVR